MYQVYMYSCDDSEIGGVQKVGLDQARLTGLIKAGATGPRPIHERHAAETKDKAKRPRVAPVSVPVSAGPKTKSIPSGSPMGRALRKFLGK